jgi:hypothetical protein
MHQLQLQLAGGVGQGHIKTQGLQFRPVRKLAELVAGQAPKPFGDHRLHPTK